MKELLIYFDEAQAIDQSSATMFRHQDSGGFCRQFAESSASYNWERAAGHDEITKDFLWHWLDAETVASLPV